MVAERMIEAGLGDDHSLGYTPKVHQLASPDARGGGHKETCPSSVLRWSYCDIDCKRECE